MLKIDKWKGSDILPINYIFMPMVEAKKYLGQHFLNNEEICQAIATGMRSPSEITKWLEVGPGRAAITKYLIKNHPKLSVVEVDGDSITYLRNEYPELHIIDADFLRINLAEVNEGKPFGLIGNFPYFISSQILTKIFENHQYIEECVGMFQKEVCEKTIATPGNKNYGIIGVFLQAFYDIEYLFTVDAKEFDPPPNVQSGVIRMVRKKETNLNCELSLFKQVVKLGFNQRRKTLRNSLKSILNDSIKDAEILSQRPEQLSVEEFVELTNLIEQNKK